MARSKPKPITREELAAMPHSELATVETKRRVLASLTPPAAKPKPKKRAPNDEKLSPRQRMARAHANTNPKRARDIRRGRFEKGDHDGRD